MDGPSYFPHLYLPIHHPHDYVSGNLLFYPEQGNNRFSFAPDVFVVLGVSNHDRRTYKMWLVEELCYESQRLIPMAEKTAMLYYCFRETFYNKFGQSLQTSQQLQQQLADQPAKVLSVT